MYKAQSLSKFAILAFILSGCATGAISNGSFTKAQEAIGNNDFESFKRELTGAKDGDGVYLCLLDHVFDMSSQDEKCRTEFVTLLLNKGATVREELHRVEYNGSMMDGILASSSSARGPNSCQQRGELTEAITSNCSAMIDIAVDRVDPVSGSQGVAVMLREGTSEQSPRYRELADRALAVTPALQRRLEKQCKREVRDDPACGALDKLLKAAQEYSQRLKDRANAKDRLAAKEVEQKAEQARNEAEEAFRNTPMGRACQAVQNIKIADQNIARERKIGASTGVMSKTTLHEMGTMKFYAEQALAKAKSELQNEGKSFDRTRCVNDP